MTHEVNNAGLHGRIREGRGDGVREAFETVHDRDQDVLHPAVLQSVITESQNLAPSLSAIHRPRTLRMPSLLTPRAT